MRFVLILFCFAGYSGACLAGTYTLLNIKHLYDISGVGEQSLSLPTDVAVDDSHIVIADGNNNRIMVYNHAGRFLYEIGGRELFKYPVGVALRGKDIVVADTGNHAVKILTKEGELIRNVAVVVDGKSERPVDVSASGSEILVSCNNSQKIQVYSYEGEVLRTWGGKGESEGQFRYPATIDRFKNGYNIVVDVLNARAQIFTNEGEFVKAIGGLGVVQGKLFRPKGVAVDDQSRIYVSDSYMDVVQVFDEQGTFLYVLGQQSGVLRFSAPGGVAVHKKRLYVVEVLANKVSVYELP